MGQHRFSSVLLRVFDVFQWPQNVLHKSIFPLFAIENYSNLQTNISYVLPCEAIIIAVHFLYIMANPGSHVGKDFFLEGERLNT